MQRAAIHFMRGALAVGALLFAFAAAADVAASKTLRVAFPVAETGFDPQAAVTLWEKMGRQGAAPPEFLSTHPSPENRRERLQALATKLEPVYRAAKRG